VMSRGLDNNILVQIGLVVLVGLAAKNAILIVEFARQIEGRTGDYLGAVVEACRLRLRPILMTAFAFILGVVPLATSSGSGAEARKLIGTAVIGGMLAASLIAIFLIPVSFTVVMRLASRLGVPIVTIVDTPGAYPGMDAEEHGQSNAIAESILGMFELRVPVVTVVTGEGGSGGALALAVADRVLMFQRSTYSVISPEGCSAILWGDAKSAADAARALRITSRELLELGVVDEVLPESCLDSSPNPAGMIATLRAAVARSVAELSDVDAAQLVQARRNRFRSFGANAISRHWADEAVR